jgi:hypothetical protein
MSVVVSNRVAPVPARRAGAVEQRSGSVRCVAGAGPAARAARGAGLGGGAAAGVAARRRRERRAVPRPPPSHLRRRHAAPPAIAPPHGPRPHALTHAHCALSRHSIFLFADHVCFGSAASLQPIVNTVQLCRCLRL